MIRAARFLKSLALPAFLGCVLLTSFACISAAYAGAAGAPASVDESSWVDLAKPVLDAALAHNYVAAFALALVLAVALAKRLTGSSRLAVFIHGDIGGALATFFLAFFGAIATAVPTGGFGALTWSLLRSTGLIAFAAAGGYALAKKLIAPYLERFGERHAWARPIVSILLWAFDKSAAIKATEAAAEQEGDAAVKANPGQGTAAVIGAPEQF